MPMMQTTDARKDSEDDRDTDSLRLKKPGQTLRQVASEVALPRPSATLAGDVQKRYAGDCVSKPVLLYQATDSDHGDGLRGERDTVIIITDLTSTCVNTIEVRSPHMKEQPAATRMEKVYPRSTSREEVYSSADSDTGFPHRRSSLLPSRHDDALTGERSVEAAAPILKDFFTKSAAGTQRARMQQKESRREQHYRTSRQRHDELRALSEREERDQLEQAQRSRIEHMRRDQQRRRLRLRAEASRLKKYVESTGDTEHQRYECERERWEQAFEEEIRILGDAYRRTRRQCDGDGDDSRPMTVAGLAATEARTLIQRDQLDTRRVQTAGAAPREPPVRWIARDFATVDGGAVYLLGEENCVHVVESGFDEPQTIQRLRRENELLARHIAEWEKLAIDSKQAVVVQGTHAKGLEDGFFI